MAEKKEDKGLDVYFPEENCPKEVKNIAVRVLDYYIKKYEDFISKNL